MKQEHDEVKETNKEPRQWHVTFSHPVDPVEGSTLHVMSTVIARQSRVLSTFSKKVGEILFYEYDNYTTTMAMHGSFRGWLLPGSDESVAACCLANLSLRELSPLIPTYGMLSNETKGQPLIELIVLHTAHVILSVRIRN